MEYGLILAGLHQVVSGLLYPVIIVLVISLFLTLWELGQSFAERFLILKAYRKSSADKKELKLHFQQYATKRLERVDLLARSGPILGLMGTLIPLGPGLTALGDGNLNILATALAVAFDTTVLGLLIGLVAYILGRVRRRWYDQTWMTLEGDSEKLSDKTVNKDNQAKATLPLAKAKTPEHLPSSGNVKQVCDAK